MLIRFAYLVHHEGLIGILLNLHMYGTTCHCGTVLPAVALAVTYHTGQRLDLVATRMRNTVDKNKTKWKLNTHLQFVKAITELRSCKRV